MAAGAPDPVKPRAKEPVAAVAVDGDRGEVQVGQDGSRIVQVLAENGLEEIGRDGAIHGLGGAVGPCERPLRAVGT